MFFYLLQAHYGRTCSDVLADEDLVYEISNHTFPRIAKEFISHPVWVPPTTTTEPTTIELITVTEPNTAEALATDTETLPYDYDPLNFEVGPRELDDSSSVAAEPESSTTLITDSGQKDPIKNS